MKAVLAVEKWVKNCALKSHRTRLLSVAETISVLGNLWYLQLSSRHIRPLNMSYFHGVSNALEIIEWFVVDFLKHDGVIDEMQTFF